MNSNCIKILYTSCWFTTSITFARFSLTLHLAPLSPRAEARYFFSFLTEVMYAKLAGHHTGTVNDAVFVPDKGSVISISEDRWGVSMFSNEFSHTYILSFKVWFVLSRYVCHSIYSINFSLFHSFESPRLFQNREKDNLVLASAGWWPILAQCLSTSSFSSYSHVLPWAYSSSLCRHGKWHYSGIAWCCNDLYCWPLMIILILCRTIFFLKIITQCSFNDLYLVCN